MRPMCAEVPQAGLTPTPGVKANLTFARSPAKTRTFDSINPASSVCRERQFTDHAEERRRPWPEPSRRHSTRARARAIVQLDRELSCSGACHQSCAKVGHELRTGRNQWRGSQHRDNTGESVEGRITDSFPELSASAVLCRVPLAVECHEPRRHRRAALLTSPRRCVHSDNNCPSLRRLRPLASNGASGHP